MLLFSFLQHIDSRLDPTRCKVHLARNNGVEEPKDVYLRGEFDEWQRWQNRANFNRPIVVSLIQNGSPNRWIFAGTFEVLGFSLETDPKPHRMYDLARIQSTAELEGRLLAKSSYKERNSYVFGETLAQDLAITELLAERVSIASFPGFKLVDISRAELDLIIRQNIESWRAALSAVKGIYLITDSTSGKLYVGKADGESGIWGRWRSYSSTGHGNNQALIKELGIAVDRQKDFRFSLLEIADIQSTASEIAIRECHWKRVLMSREYGYNLN